MSGPGGHLITITADCARILLFKRNAMQATIERHTRIRDLIRQAGSHFVSVVFLKKDGSERRMTFNPLDFAEIKGTGHPTDDPNIFRIRDSKLSAWRSFDARRVVSIKVDGVVTLFTEAAE